MGLFRRKKSKNEETKSDAKKIKWQAGKASEPAEAKKDNHVYGDDYSKTASSNAIIKWPVMSERALNLIAEENQYIFVVNRKATKPEIKKQIEKLYKVDVEKVRTIRMKKEEKKFRGIRGRGELIKKAIVTVKKGQKINISGNI